MKRLIVVYLALVALMWLFVPLRPVRAQSATGVRVIRVPALAEPPTTYYGIDYLGLTRYTVGTSGTLTIYDLDGSKRCVWAAGQWNRIEKIE